MLKPLIGQIHSEASWHESVENAGIVLATIQSKAIEVQKKFYLIAIRQGLHKKSLRKLFKIIEH